MSSALGTWQVIGTSGVVCIHSLLLPNSRLLCMERPHEAPFPQNENTNGRTAVEIRLLNDQGEIKPSWTLIPPSSNTFCAGHAQMPDGSLLVVGGDVREMPAESETKYLKDGRRGVRRYLPCKSQNCSLGSWRDEYEMSTERWYPTVTQLPDGNAIIISGTRNFLDLENYTTAISNPTYEYYPPKNTSGWPRKLDILEWAFPFVLYPQVFTLPSGKVFLMVSNKTNLIDPKTDEITSPIPDLVVGNNQMPLIYPYSPTMVMLPLTPKNNYQAQLLVCGGSFMTPNNGPEGSKACRKIKPDAPNPQWEVEDDMPRGRVMIDSTILPDGKVMFVNGAGWGLAGGAQGGDTTAAGDPVFEPSIYDPEAPSGQRWARMANASVPRLYHSGVILLESGHVITLGSEMQNYIDTQGPTPDKDCFPLGAKKICTSPYEYRLELYTPPYLLTGKARPELISTPETLTYKSKFMVQFKAAQKIQKASFIRYSTTTHSTNMDQRFIELRSLGQADGKLYLEAPDNSALAPSGNWMLFVLSDGVPSIAKTISLGPGPESSVEIPDNAKSSGSEKIAYFTPLLFMGWALSALF